MDALQAAWILVYRASFNSFCRVGKTGLFAHAVIHGLVQRGQASCLPYLANPPYADFKRCYPNLFHRRVFPKEYCW